MEESLKWRSDELALVKIYLVQSRESKPRFRVAYRCFVATLYAHYEGFIKEIAAEALSEIKMRKLRPVDLISFMQPILFGDSIRKMLSAKSNAELVALISGGFSTLCSASYIKEKEITDIGNLDFDNLCWVVAAAGIDPAKIAQYRQNLNRLTYLRHQCAHGDALLFLNDAEIKDLLANAIDLYSETIEFMHFFAVEIVENFESNRFLSDVAVS